MGPRLFLASLLAALAMLAWGLAWWVLLPFQEMATRSIKDEAVVGLALAERLPEEGVYVMPAFPEEIEDPDAAMQTYITRHRTGPVAHIFFVPGGAEPFDPGSVMVGYVQLFLQAVLLGLLLILVRGSIGGWGAQLSLAALVGLIAVVGTDLAHPIWLPHPWRYWLYTSLFDLGTFIIAGAVLGWFLRRRPQEQPIPAAAITSEPAGG